MSTTALLLTLTALSGAPSLTPEAACAAQAQLRELMAQLTSEAPADAPTQAVAEPSCQDDPRLASLLGAASDLLDEGRDTDARIDAAQRLALLGDERAVVFLAAASRERDVGLQVASLAAAAAYPGAASIALGRARLIEEHQPDAVHRAAIDLLVAVNLPEAGAVLLEIAEDDDLPNATRADALDAVLAHYPQLLEGRETPAVPRSWAGNALTSAATGVVGGVMLSSVGEWGKFGPGAAIGAVGGGVIGAGAGAFYAWSRPRTLGQGMAYGSAVGWGLDLGARVSQLTEASDDVAAGLRVAGVAVGAGAGFYLMGQDPDPSSVLEVDTAGWVGAEIGAATAVIVQSTRHQLGVPDNLYAPHGAIAGSAVGLTTGLLLKDKWALTPEAAAYAAVTGAELGIASSLVPSILDNGDFAGPGRLGLHLGVAAGLGVAALKPVGYERAGWAAYGAAMGNALGLGAPSLVSARPSEQGVSALVAGAGLAGLVGGTLVAPRMDASSGDLAMLAVGIPLAGLEGLGVGYYLADEDIANSDFQRGLSLTGVAVAGVGLAALGQRVDPEPGKMAFLATAATWGAFYGFGMPLALDHVEGLGRLALSTTLTADAFLAGGALLMSPLVDLAPSATVIPQLAGLTGATVGALSVALTTSESRPVVQGALIGATVGLVGGGITSAVLAKHHKEVALHIPTHLGLNTEEVVVVPTVAPWTADDGEPGMYFGLQVAGF